jgi:hypothetical protein
MLVDVQNLPDDPAQLKQIISVSSRCYQEQIHYLEELVRLLRNEIFGCKSEKRPAPESDRQQRLFDKVAEGGEGSEPTTGHEAPERIPVAPHQRRKAARKPLPADLPRIEMALADLGVGRVICLMCMEVDPDRCHRKTEIAARLVALGVEVRHLKKFGKPMAEQTRIDKIHADTIRHTAC